MPSRTRADDLNYALHELDELAHPPEQWIAEGIRPVREDIAAGAAELLRELIFRPGLALPQLAEWSGGGVRIWWMGGGEQLTVEIGADEVNVVATRGQGDTVFRFDGKDFRAVTRAAGALDQMRGFLAALGGGPGVLVW